MSSFKAVFLDQEQFTPRGYLAMSGDIFGCSICEGAIVYWIKAKDASKYPITHRKAPYDK